MKSQRSIRAAFGLLLTPLLAHSLTGAQQAESAPSSQPNVVVQWNNTALQAIRDTKMGPPMASRALAIIDTCIYDAWTAYDDRALGSRLAASLRQPQEARTPANKNRAISFAAYRASVDLFPSEDTIAFRPLMAQLGYNPDDHSTDRTTATGIGNVACSAVLEFRHHDGSNQLGDLTPSGVSYADYTGFTPLNPPSTVPVNPATVADPNHWQPLQYFDATHTLVTQKFLGAQWFKVVPFALRSDDQFRSQLQRFGPATFGSSAFLEQVEELVALSGGLTDRQKMIAEYFADGPHSETPPGHWCLYALSVSARDHHTVDQDAKMFFAMTNAVFDAGIVAWDAKQAFDSVRPVTAIPYTMHGQQIRCWGGPGKGTVSMDGSSWIPYQPGTFPTPPFPEFISGHSTFSAAAAEVLRRFTGSDAFGETFTVPAGSSTTEPGVTPAATLTLQWDTFTAAANDAGISRRYGGIHFKAADLLGRAAGRAVGYQAWVKAENLWLGKQGIPNTTAIDPNF